MERYFGAMPIVEIEIEKMYKDSDGNNVTIQAGPHGWAVLYHDTRNIYQDIDDTSENNFNAAYNTAVEKIGQLNIGLISDMNHLRGIASSSPVPEMFY